MTSDEIVNDHEYWYDDEYYVALKGLYVRLRLVQKFDIDKLSLYKLKRHGLNGPPQGPIKVQGILADYIEKCIFELNEYIEKIIKEDNVITEGKQEEIFITSRERNPIARKRCLEKYGYSCQVCNIDFENVYGKVGRNYIHVHHIKFLSDIVGEHVVNPEDDLIPVWPNCHAMLHTKEDGRYLSVEELKKTH